MEKKIFLSYSHKDKELCQKLELLIPKHCPNTIIITDEKAARGEELHKEISKLVNAAHIVIPIITESWLLSDETRDELVRSKRKAKAYYMLSIL